MSNGDIIRALLEKGYRVYVSHGRYFGGYLRSCGDLMRNRGTLAGVENNGGQTIVDLKDRDGRSFEGVAVCSKRDSYNRRLGLTIALGRALKAAGLSAADLAAEVHSDG